jgi:hypothetical protein
VGCKQSVENKTNENISDCEKGILKAEQDAKKGKYEILSYGMPDYPDWNFQMFYEDFVKEIYGIIIGNGGCVIYEEKECYADKMEEIVLIKYGEDIFEKARKDARKKFKEHIQSQINDDYIFSSIDTLPKFVNEKENLNSYLTNRLKNDREFKGRVLAIFIVEKNGDLSEIEIKHGTDKEFDQRLSNVLTEMPKWNSGVYLGQKVRTRISLPIIINEKN